MPSLHFKGKTFVQNHHLAVKYHQLIPKKELSLTDKVSLHDNLIIQGDNLKALKALLPTYAGKIKCIFIDPPYNTGNESWVYNDNVNSPMLKEWLGKVVDKEDLTRHDKWLCMMMPRLKLLRELLSEDGTIFITIDDNEYHNLRVLLDELYGEQNFVAVFMRRRRKTQANLAKNIAPVHEYTVCYCKNIENFDAHKIPYSEEFIKKTFSNPDRDKRGSYQTGPLARPENSTNKEYTLTMPNGRKIKAKWSCSQETFDRYIKENRLVIPRDGEGMPRIKIFLSELDGQIPNTWWDDVATNDEASKEIEEIFGSNSAFSFPKPTGLIKRILQLATDKNSIILDSFAGSGTTAHAVLDLNNEDGGNRKFILVEMEEYADQITAERIRRVIKGVKTAKNEKLKKGTGGTFSYFELGETIEMENLLKGKNLPSFTEFARYLFYTATGEEFNEKLVNEKTGFIGESKNFEVYLIYKPDIEWLKRNALTLEGCRGLPKFKTKQRLVFAPCKYVDDYTCLEHRIDFCQLPYEIYRIQK